MVVARAIIRQSAPSAARFPEPVTCCGKVSFDVPIASSSLAREETKAGVKSQMQACRARKRIAIMTRTPSRRY